MIRFFAPVRALVIFTALAAVTIFMMPLNAHAQKSPLKAIQNTLGLVPGPTEPDIQQRLSTIEALLQRIAPKFVFVTSEAFPGNLGGLSGADAICQRLADAAGLTGTYKAWLSDSVSSPDTRFFKSSAPYLRTDGLKVADNYTDLTDGTLSNPVNADETGNRPMDSNVWSGTSDNGTANGRGQHCADWQSTTGNGSFGVSDATNRNWTDTLAANMCSASDHRFYCVEQ